MSERDHHSTGPTGWIGTDQVRGSMPPWHRSIHRRPSRIPGWTIAAAIGCLVGLAAGVLLLDQQVPDVLTVAATLFVLAVWTGAAGYVGALIERRANDARFDDMLDAALALRSHGERMRAELRAIDDELGPVPGEWP